MKSLELSLFADYFPFYIQDETATGDLSQAWNEQATERLLAIAPERSVSAQCETCMFQSPWTFSKKSRTMTPPNGITLLKPAWTLHLDGS